MKVHIVEWVKVYVYAHVLVSIVTVYYAYKGAYSSFEAIVVVMWEEVWKIFIYVVKLRVGGRYEVWL